jgi:hypothetical protein
MTDSTLDILNAATDEDAPEEVEETQEDDKIEGEEEQEEEQEEADEGEEEEQEEGQEEEETEEDEEESVDEPPSSLARSLSEKHKGIFKEFPQLRGILFREGQYKEVFPTVEEAKDAYDRSETLAYLENSVGTGSAEPLLDTLDEAALERFSKEFVPGLAKKNPKIAHKALLPVMNGMLRSALSVAQRSQNKNLGTAVQLISQFLNGTNEIPETSDPDEDPQVKKKLNELSERERQMQTRAHVEFSKKVTGAGDKKLMLEIRKAFDSDKNLSEIERDALAERTFKRVVDRLASDGNHIRGMDSLWARARKAGYSEEWIPRIITAMLGGARSLLPGVRAKVRAEALKHRKPAKKAGIVVNSGSPGKTRVGSEKVVGLKKGNIDWKKTSTLDIFSGNAKLKSK